MSKSRLFIAVFFLAALPVLAFVTHRQISSQLDESELASRIIITERLHDAIESRLQGPILVAQAMASDTFLKECLENESSCNEEKMNEQMKEYLEAFRKSGDYAAAFLVSEGSKKYFTYEGLNKVIDPDKDPHDVWYSVFVNSGTPYGLDVDVNEANGQGWTVFVNGRMESGDGRLLGVCGVGIEMTELQKLFKTYEEQYGIKVDIVNQEGLVQADSGSLNIQTTHHTDLKLSSTEDYVYTKKGENGYFVTKYIDETDWYLVVQGDQTQKKRGAASSFLTVFLLLSLAGTGYFVIWGGKGKRSKDGSKAMTDPVTGLPNHYYFKENYGEQGIFHTTRYKAVAVLDIDSFLDVEQDPEKKEALLKSVAERAKSIMGDKAEMFFWGGDQFLFLMEWSADFSDGLCRELCKQIAEEGKITISVGLTEVRLADTIKTNYYRALQGCYLVKEMGGNGVKWN